MFRYLFLQRRLSRSKVSGLSIFEEACDCMHTVQLFKKTKNGCSSQDILVKVTAWVIRDLDQVRYADIVVGNRIAVLEGRQMDAIIHNHVVWIPIRTAWSSEMSSRRSQYSISQHRAKHCPFWHGVAEVMVSITSVELVFINVSLDPQTTCQLITHPGGQVVDKVSYQACFFYIRDEGLA